MTSNCTPLDNITQYFTILRQLSYAVRSRTSIAYKRVPFNQIPNQIFWGDSWFGLRPYLLSPHTILTEFYIKLHFSIISRRHIKLCALERSLGLNCHLKLQFCTRASFFFFFNNFKPFKIAWMSSFQSSQEFYFRFHQTLPLKFGKTQKQNVPFRTLPSSHCPVLSNCRSRHAKYTTKTEKSRLIAWANNIAKKIFSLRVWCPFPLARVALGYSKNKNKLYVYCKLLQQSYLKLYSIN